MKFVSEIAEGFARWLDCVAAAIVAARGRFVASRTIHLVEGADGAFTVLPAQGAAALAEAERVQIVDGKVVGSLPATLESRMGASCIEVVLQPTQFVFRPLELPRRAGEFLEGIVRSQIDRLTPWPAEDAAFGWSKPSDIANDRIVVTVAATARALIAPIVQALAGRGADAIVVSTVAPGDGAVAIKVFEQKMRGALEVQRLRRALVGILVVAGLLAGAAVAADVVIGGSLQARQDDVTKRIAASRDSVLGGLERRKHETPSSVIVIEALSRIFPDHTYVTELRIVGDKMQVVGITRDAPSLIRLIEQSSYFTRATFFAPTTQSPSQPGENFHIEAQIQPIYTPPT
ncbi:MAG: PilN domain-containing protein [Xanthobacteraceae bacterium]